MKTLRSIFLLLSISSLMTFAQDAEIQPKSRLSKSSVAITAGSTGVGLEVGAPVNDYLRLRVGATYMPKFRYSMVFTAQVGSDEQVSYDKEGNRLPTRFEKMADMLEAFVGQPVDDKVDMYASPNFNQLKFMADVYPFRNRNWHFTAGFYLGKSRIARAINKTNETSSLFAINIYNRLYDNQGEFLNGFSLPPEYLIRLLTYGKAGFHMGDYTSEARHYDEDFEDWVVDHEKGDAYMMTPNNDNTVFADAFVSKFRPYFGVGYEGSISKDKRWNLGFDAGIMFWGGTPKLLDHSGVDLMHDVENVRGQVGDYIELARHVKAFPVLEIKIARRLF